MAVIDRGIGLEGEGFVLGDPGFEAWASSGPGLAAQLSSVGDWLDEIAGRPLTECAGPELKAVVAATRRVRGCADRVIMRSGAIARQRQAASDSPPTSKRPGREQSPEAGGQKAEDTSTLFDEVMGGADGSETASAARQDAARAELMAALPLIGAAVAAGRIGAGHVDALARAFRRFDTPEAAAGVLDTPSMVADAAALPVDTFTRRLWRIVNGILDRETRRAEAQQKRDSSAFRHWFDRASGMGRISGQFDPERYEAIITAIEQHTTTLANEGKVAKNSNLAAAAVHDLITGSGKRGTNLPHLTVIVGPDGEPETADGRALTPESASRLACDAVMRRVVVDGRGVATDVGRASRTATDGQWAAIKALYTRCAWEGCTAPISWCQAHHIHYWENGGPTDMCNLIPVCSKHHHLIHDQGWALRLRPEDRRLTILRPIPGGHREIAHTWPDRNPIQRE